MTANSASKLPPASLTGAGQAFPGVPIPQRNSQNNNNPRHMLIGRLLNDPYSVKGTLPSPPRLSDGVGERGYFGPEVIRPVPRIYHSEEALEEVYGASNLPKLLNELAGWIQSTNFDRAYQINHYNAENGMSNFVNSVVKIVEELRRYNHIPQLKGFIIKELKPYWSYLGSALKIAEKKELNEENFIRLTSKLERIRQEQLQASPVGNTSSRDSPVQNSPNAQSSSILTPDGALILKSLKMSLNVECDYREGGRVPCANDFIAVEFLKECLS